MTILGLIWLGLFAWGCVYGVKRMLRTGGQASKTECRHERLRVPDGEVNVCWSCGKVMR